MKDSLEQLREHPQSLSAVCLASKSYFRVRRKKTNGCKIIRVKDLKRKQAEALEQEDQQPLKRQFSFAVQASSWSLQSQEQQPAATSNLNLVFLKNRSCRVMCVGTRRGACSFEMACAEAGPDSGHGLCHRAGPVALLL